MIADKINITNDKEHYNWIYKSSEEYGKNPENSVYYPIWKHIIEMLDDKPVYDVGCGSGQLAKLIIQNGKNFVKGWDYCVHAIKLAKRINKDDSDKFEVKDIYDLNKFSENDIVVCTEVLEHLDNDFHIINLLSPGTRFIFSVPNFYSDTHKRIFNDTNHIKNRYDILNINDEKEFSVKSRKIKLSNKGKNKIFLIDSVCR